jgi:hypothetical protein
MLLSLYIYCSNVLAGHTQRMPFDADKCVTRSALPARAGIHLHA